MLTGAHSASLPIATTPSAQFDVLLSAEATDPAYSGYEAGETERYSNRLTSGNPPQIITPMPPMTQCGSRYYVLRFRTIDGQPVKVFLVGMEYLDPFTEEVRRPLSPPDAELSAGVSVLSGCSVVLFQATEATEPSHLVDIVVDDVQRGTIYRWSLNLNVDASSKCLWGWR